jgi:hypothetical protein
MTRPPLVSDDVPSARAVTRSALQRARRVVAVAPFVVSTLSGCYSYARVDGSSQPPVGATVAAEITDQGRVALADSLGPSPRRVEGRLVSASDSTITLAVTAVRSLQGDRTPWTGERVTLPRSSFSGVTQRRLSVARTAIAGAVAVGGLVALAIALGITGDGDGEPGDRTNPPPTGEQ